MKPTSTFLSPSTRTFSSRSSVSFTPPVITPKLAPSDLMPLAEPLVLTRERPKLLLPPSSLSTAPSGLSPLTVRLPPKPRETPVKFTDVGNSSEHVTGVSHMTITSDVEVEPARFPADVARAERNTRVLTALHAAQEEGRLFRGSGLKETRESVDAFGMLPADPTNESLQAAVHRGKASNFVHTSRSFILALSFANANANSDLYVISDKAPGAVDLSTRAGLLKHGIHDTFAYEKAVSVRGGIRPEHLEQRVAVKKLAGPAPGAVKFTRVEDRSTGEKRSSVSYYTFEGDLAPIGKDKVASDTERLERLAKVRAEAEHREPDWYGGSFYE